MTDAPVYPRKITSKHVKIDMPAAQIVTKMGGLTNFCETCGFNTSAVHRWMKNGVIPNRIDKDRDVSTYKHIINCAAEKGVTVTPADFIEA